MPRPAPRLWAALAAAPALLPVARAHAALPNYTLAGSFSVPTTQFGTPLPFDVLPDGRLIYADGNTLLTQPATNAAGAVPLGSIDPAIGFPFGAAFLRISPSGATLAIGNNQGGPNGRVAFVDVAGLNTLGASPASVVNLANFDAEWRDDDRLYVTGAGAAGDRVAEVRRSTLLTRDVLNLGGAGSAGITARAGRLYTGNGFDGVPGGTETGDIRAFSFADLDAAPSPLPFETAGLPVADALSAASLGFDSLGNLLVGGGEFGGDGGYAGVVDADALAAALAGAGEAPDAAELRLSPAGNDFYLIAFNEVTSELLVVAGSTAYRYAVPNPGTLTVLAASGLLVSRRRRRAL